MLDIDNTIYHYLSCHNYALDILIFIAPTKDDQIYWLSYGRYAPVQIIYGAGGGTTGLCNSIDYFFVSDKMANQEAKNIKR